LKNADGAAVPRIGLGCMGMSEFYGARDDAQALRALHLAYELGYRHFDTADMYGDGHNEELLASFLRALGPSRRGSVYLATKVGIRRVPGSPPSVEIDSSPSWVSRACDASMRRLGVDHIDLLYLHRRSPAVPIEDTMGAMASLAQSGKIRGAGLSEVSADTLRRAHVVFPVKALQSEYSLWTRDVEGCIMHACADLGVAFVAYSPLGRAFLSGGLTADEIARDDDLRRHLPRFIGDNFAANSRLLDELRDVAREAGATMAETALSWLLGREEFVYLIPGSRNETHVRANFAAGARVLSADHRARLSSRFALHAAAGDRLPPQLLRTVNL
jgi:aryl-alcohol dehydrogenase-like predicted oxidoreductase